MPELEQHLVEQIGFLKSSATAFDGGLDSEAKRLAATLRILLHDTSQSHSLLGQLGRLSGNFFSTADPITSDNLSTYGGLVVISQNAQGARYIAVLDDVPFTRWTSFSEWWSEIIFIDNQKASLSRKQLVLAIANQDGGAHVGPELSRTYANLSRGNSQGWVALYEGKPGSTPIPGAELAAVRQISHEVLKTLIPSYKLLPVYPEGLLIGGVQFVPGPSAGPRPKSVKYGRNELCPCGSGKKYKHCHGVL